MKKETKNDKKDKEVKISTIIISLLMLAAAAILMLSFFIYTLGWKNDFIKKVEKILPYPAALINRSSFITIGEINSNLSAVKKFYESQNFSEVNLRVDFSTENGQKRLRIKEKEVFNRMIEDKAIEIIARKKGIKITNKLVDQSFKRKLEEYDSEEELKNNLKQLYGWSIDDFKVKIVKPDIYKQELKKTFESENTSVAEAKSQAEKANEELSKNKNFSDVAKNYSKGSTAQDGGELGWFKKDQLIAEISDIAFSLEKGKRSNIIESPLGFHIIELEDKKTENENELVRIRQIFLPKKTFGEFLTEEMKKMKFTVFVKDYSWNNENAVLEFKDSEMKKFEQNIIENSQGDASVLF